VSNEKKEKLTDSDFCLFGFLGYGNLLLDGKVDIGWFEAFSYQSTSHTKIAGGLMPDKRETAQFVHCGKYWRSSKNSSAINETYSFT